MGATLTNNLEQQFMAIVNNVVTNSFLMRRDFIDKLTDPRRNLEEECGYPWRVDRTLYREMYDREGVAARVVSLWPDECWSAEPKVYETEDPDETDFELTLKALMSRHYLPHYWHRVDELSGIGHFGILLLGIDDGKDLLEPANGIKETGEVVPGAAKDRKLLYIRPFDESLVYVSQYQTDSRNPRYGLPLFYNVNFVDPNAIGVGPQTTLEMTRKKVHWSRVVHIADNRKNSEVFGEPRQQNVFNRLLDLRKVLGGSAEMFYKGGFPGISVEMMPELAIQGATFDTDKMKEELAMYMNGLQRFLTLTGVTAKPLLPNIAQPEMHIDAQINAICITKGVPKRIFQGSEAAQLASGQDQRTWNKRLTRRNDQYLTPHVIRATIDRLIALGCLVPPKEDYNAEWPDLNSPTDLDKATAALAWTQALAAYAAGNVEAIVPLLEFLTIFFELPIEKAQAIVDAALEAENRLTEEPPDPLEMQQADQQHQSDMADKGFQAQDKLTDKTLKAKKQDAKQKVAGKPGAKAPPKKKAGK